MNRACSLSFRKNGISNMQLFNVPCTLPTKIFIILPPIFNIIIYQSKYSSTIWNIDTIHTNHDLSNLEQDLSLPDLD